MEFTMEDKFLQDLKILQNHSVQVLSDFCKLTWDYLKNGANMKLYQTASHKLATDSSAIQCAVQGLAFFFIECSKSQMTEASFEEAVNFIGFPNEFHPVLYEEYITHNDLLSTILPLMSVQHWQYKDLQWRFQAQVSSKCLKVQCQPKVMLKLDLTKGGTEKSIALEADMVNIVHMSQVLNQALQESRSHHTRRIQRAIS